MAKQTPGSKCDTGSKYELSVTALFAAFLSKNENVENYRIFSNFDAAQPFDDIVAEVRFKGVEQCQTYAIQVKSGKDKLNINKYCDGYDKIIGKGGLKLGENVREEPIYFWYFCSKHPAKDTFSMIRHDDSIDLKLRPRDRPYNIHEIIFDNTASYELYSEDPKLTDHENFFNRFYLFLNQPGTQKIINIIKGMWNIDNPWLILLYLDNYFAKNADGLDKAAFEHELLKLRLHDYVVTPTRAIALQHRAVYEWNRLTLEQDVTIVCNETNIEPYLFGCILQNISDVISLDEWNRCVENVGKLERDVKSRLKAKSFKPETLKDLLMQVWMDGKAPLPLRVDTSLSLLEKFSHLNKSYIIIDSEVDKRYNEMRSYELQVFRHLGDVEAEKITKEILVSVQGRKPVSLYKIIEGDKKLMQTVTCLHIINLIKPREVHLKRECLERNDYMFFVIETSNPQVCRQTERRLSGTNTAVYCKPGESYNYCNRIRADPRFKSYKICRLRLTDENKLTLLPNTVQHEEEYHGLECFFIDRNGESVYMENGDIIPIIGEVPIHVCWRYVPRCLREHVKENKQLLNEDVPNESNTRYNGRLLTEKDFFTESSGKITVITGDPGIGKTTLLHSLFGFCESEYYVLFVDLARHQVDLHRGKLKSFQHLIDFARDRCNSLQYNSFLNSLYDYPNRLVLILDSFDEIVATCKQQILVFITNLLKIGLQKVIIASRLAVVNLLVSNFAAETFKVEGINDECDKYYTYNWNLNITGLHKIPTEFLTNPLYLNMLRTISENEVNLEVVDRWNLYESVVKLKMEDYCQRICLDETEKQYALVKHGELALKVMFGSNKVTEKLEQKLQPNYSNFMRLGFVISYDNGSPVFVHHTFVEFFIVKWLIANIGNDDAKFIYSLMLNDHKSDILDIHSETIPLHKAVLDQNIKNVGDLCKDNPKCLLQTDDLGRNALHLATIHFIDQGVRILNFLIQQMRNEGYDIYVRDRIMNWTWIDYFEKYVFEGYWYRCKVALREAYLNYYATHIEKLENCKFSLNWHFEDCYETAIYYSSISLIRVLLYLKYHKNKAFLQFREICLHSSFRTRRELLSIYLPEEKLKGVHLACIYGNIETIKTYIDSGTSFNETDKFKCTPLHYSVIAEQNNEIVKLLIENCKISNLYVGQNNNYTTILHMSVRTGNVYVTEMVLERVKANLQHKKWHTSLLSRIKPFSGKSDSTHLQVIQTLLMKRDKQLYTLLELAVKHENEDMVKMLLKYNAEVNFWGRRCRTPLCVAVRQQNRDIVGLLLRRGADPNYMQEELTSPLMLAVDKADEDITQMLLDHHANVNFEDKFEGTSLYGAIATERTTIIEMLLRNGAHVNCVHQSGWTPLTYAIYLNNSKDVVQTLLKYNADVNLKDKNGESPLSTAIRRKTLEVIELLLRNGARTDCMSFGMWTGRICVDMSDNKSTPKMLLNKSISLEGKHGIMPLCAAIKLKSPDIVQMLLNHQADANYADEYGLSPLLTAVETGNTQITKMLLDHNADVNFKNEYGITALYVAAFKGNAAMVELLLDHGADANVMIFAEEIFHKAKSERKIEVFVRLLENRIVGHHSSVSNVSSEPNSATNIIESVTENWASIHLDEKLRTAVKERFVNLSTIETLKQWGGDIDIDDEFWTAVFCLCEEMDDEMIDCVLLRNLGRSRRERLVRKACRTSENRNLDLIKILARCLLSCAKFLRTAIELNDMELVKIALQNPAALKLTDSYETPLCVAVHLQNVDIVRVLLEHNCAVNEVDGHGFTPLIIAAGIGNLEIAEMLLVYGADVNYTVKGSGASPLHTAAVTENRSMVNMLLKYGADCKNIGISGYRPKKHSAAVVGGDKSSTSENVKKIRQIIEQESTKVPRMKKTPKILRWYNK